MKKTLRGLVVLVVVLALMVAMSLTAFAADDPTEVVVTWDGGGVVEGSASTGDTNTTFSSMASWSNGTFTVKDFNNDPYGYGVDSVTTSLVASVTDGFVRTDTERLTSKSSYGDPGQTSYVYASASGGSTSMATRVSTNYASLIVPTYKFQLPGGHNIVADATAYEMWTGVTDGQGNSGNVYAIGNGVAELDAMVSVAGRGIRLAWGGGCYTDANFSATGDGGQFKATVIGNSEVTFEGMGITAGGGNLQIISNWLGSIDVDDYSATAK
jgi:hypothetical protein